MKNKILIAAAVIAVSALAGGLISWAVVKAGNGNTSAAHKTQQVVNSNFDGAGAHFTTYTEQGYPDLTYAAENAVKAVVGVIKTEEIPQAGYGTYDPFFEFFGIPRQMPQDEGQTRYREQTSGGSGVIVSPDGYIVTNHHVVENASRLSVKLPDGKKYDARLIGTDADTEIALIKIDATGLPSIPFGSSEALRIGEWVLAIGNPFSLHSTVTAGIVSAKSRSLNAIQTPEYMDGVDKPVSGGIESFIQTDAAVNPGNSGGALVNTKGELVGINTLILSRTGYYAGYSFAVPETIVRKVVADLREFGVVQRALLGIAYWPIDDGFIEELGEETGIEETGGVYVTDVAEGGAAQAAGIRKGDVITEIDGMPVIDGATVDGIMALKRPGDVVKISAKRDGKVKQFDIVLRNRAGKSELLPKNSFDAIEELGGEFAEVRLTDRQQRELGIKDGIEVVSIDRDGILARAKVRTGFIIIQINGRNIRSVSDLYVITDRITTIAGVYPGRGKMTYSLVPNEE